PTATVVGVVAGERVHQRIDGHVVNVARAVRIYFHLGAVGPHTQYTAAEHGQPGAVAIGGVMETEVAHGDVYPTIDAQLKAVSGMVGTPVGEVGGVAQVGNQRLRGAIGDTVVIVIL